MHVRDSYPPRPMLIMRLKPHWKNRPNCAISGRLAADVLDMIGASMSFRASAPRSWIASATTISCNVQQTVPANVGYRGFPKTVCTSVNHVVCHGIPNDRVLKSRRHRQHRCRHHQGRLSRRHQPHVLTWASRRRSMAQRLTETCFRGPCGAASSRCGRAPISATSASRDSGSTPKLAGFSVVREYCGHGIGRIYHEDPQVLHYGDARHWHGTESPAWCSLIEPMINAGKRHTRLMPDGWTVVTKDHSLSAQWEHMVLVTSSGRSMKY